MRRCPIGLGFRPLQALKFRIEQAERTPWGNYLMIVSWIDDCAPLPGSRKGKIALETVLQTLIEGALR